MEGLCADLLGEYTELADFAERLSDQQWLLPSRFYGWTPYDEIAHLCYFDEAGLLAARNPEAFQTAANALMKQIMAGKEINAIARERYAGLSPLHLLDCWRNLFHALVETLAAMDTNARLPWYGPSMGTRSFITARQMETWAHGQDIYDVAKVRRPLRARLRNVAHLGASTFAWSFQNRKMAVPAVPPFVSLKALDGQNWEWGDPSDSDYVRGTAEDFCLVVTQRRHVRDTALKYRGEAASAWLAMAQCFAGPPVDGPAPGERVVAYLD